MRYLGVAAATAASLLLTTSLAPAQHHHGHHRGHVPVHHGHFYGHHNWHHVVPHHATYVGGYYTVGHTHYYTPTPIVPVVVVVDNPAAPPPVEVQRPVEVAFDGFSRYEDLAGRLVAEANAMCLDLHYNYQKNKGFAHVYAEAYDVLQAAKYLHGKEHQGDRATIRKRMADVDGLFHHVQEEVGNWTRTATKQIGTNTLQEKVAGVEAVLHHLCYDVGVKPHEQPAEAAPFPGATDEVAPPPQPVAKP